MEKNLLALALLSVFAAPAFPDETAPRSLTANAGLVSDYILRGISQSQHKPALQGGVDYAHASGLYVGLWGSTVEWVDRSDYVYHDGNHVELDLYGGFRGAAGDFTYDLGLVRYYYPGDLNRAPAGKIQNPVTANTTEAYVGGGWKFVSLKYSRAISRSFVGWGGSSSDTRSRGSDYLDLSVTYPIAETVNLLAHVGHQRVRNNSYANYTDWKLGVTKDFGFAILGLAYTDTNARYKAGRVNGADYESAYNWSAKDVSKPVVTVSVLKNF
ncbi:MAG: TorF family putative porin [Rhodocyclaceae bacterium]